VTPEQIEAIGKVIGDILVYGFGGASLLVLVYSLFKPPR
jgi:hypothetical protein